MAALAFDAFISYSRVDKVFASRLAKALAAYTPPRDLAVPQRHLRVFRDEEDFTGVDYYASIERHLTGSGSLIVLCSPHARRSRYVDDEIQRFAAARGADRIIPVLCSGIPNNEATGGQEDERAFPEALCTLLTMPLAVNYVGFDPKKDRVEKAAFENAWYALLANLFQIGRSELEQREKRRQARASRIRNAIIGAFLLSILLGLAVSLYQWHEATVARDVARSRELAAHAMAQTQSDPDLSVKLAQEALRVRRTDEAAGALREALLADRVLAVMAGKRAVRSAALSRDRQSLLTGEADHVLRRWRVENGELLAELRGHTDLIAEATFSVDGRRAATASWDGTARIWDLSDNRELRQLAHGKVPVNSAQFSPDGQFLATGAGDGTVRIWNAVDGDLVHKIDAHSWRKSIVYGLTRVAYSPDGKRLLSSAGHVSTATGEPIARLWDTGSAQLLRELPTGSGVVLASRFSADGTRVFTATDGAGGRVWDATSGNLLAEFDRHTGLVRVAAFSPDGSSALTADNTAGRVGTILISDALTGARRAGLYGLATAASFDSTGERVATGNDGGARVWSARSGELLHDFRGHFGDVVALFFGSDDTTLITASEDGTARVWDLQAPSESAPSGLNDGHAGPEFSPDGKWIVAESSTDAIVWDAAHGTRVAEFGKREHMATIKARAAFARDGRLMVVGDQSVTAPRTQDLVTTSGRPAFAAVHLPEFAWFRSRDEKLALIPQDNYAAVVRELGSWRQMSELRGHQGQIGGAVFAPDSTWVLTASEDGSARVWEVATGRQVHELKLDNRGYAVRLSPDGRLALVVVDWAGIKLWDTATWQVAHAFTWPAPQSGGNWAKVAEFSPDGALLVAGDDRGVLHIFDVATRKELASVPAHKYKVSTLAFSTDGRSFVTTGEGDRGARVWASATGKWIANLGTEPVVGAAFQPDGSQIATLDRNGTVRTFNWLRFAPLDDLIQLAAKRVKRDWTERERETYFHESAKP